MRDRNIAKETGDLERPRQRDEMRRERILLEKNKAGRARTSPEAEADGERWSGLGAEIPQRRKFWGSES